MDSFSAKAIDVMGQNNRIMKEQLARSEPYLERLRQLQARETGKAKIQGPVALPVGAALRVHPRRQSGCTTCAMLPRWA